MSSSSTAPASRPCCRILPAAPAPPLRGARGDAPLRRPAPVPGAPGTLRPRPGGGCPSPTRARPTASTRASSSPPARAAWPPAACSPYACAAPRTSGLRRSPGATPASVRALAAVFPSMLVLPGTTNVVLASPAPLVRDPERPRRTARRARPRGAAGDARLPALALTNDRVAEIAGRLATTPAPENRDARPGLLPVHADPLAVALLPGRSACSTCRRRAGTGLAAAGAALALVALAGRRRERIRRTLLVVAAGFLGMVLEGALILAYQVRARRALPGPRPAADAVHGRPRRGLARRRPPAARTRDAPRRRADRARHRGGLRRDGALLLRRGSAADSRAPRSCSPRPAPRSVRLFGYASLARVTEPARRWSRRSTPPTSPAAASARSSAASCCCPILGLPGTALLLAVRDARPAAADLMPKAAAPGEPWTSSRGPHRIPHVAREAVRRSRAGSPS